MKSNFGGSSGSCCNPSYSGGRDQDDGGSKPAQDKSLQDPILKKKLYKKGWQSGSRCRPSTNKQTNKQKSNKNKKIRYL
jgi:hypothetical protein